MVDEVTIKHALKQAAAIVADVPELSPELRDSAFKIVLQHLLAAGSEPVALPPGSPPTAGEATGLSINEFLARVNPHSHVDRVVAIAHHAYQNENTGVTAKDIAEAYNAARVKKPRNIADVIRTCIQKGYLLEGDRKAAAKAWLITPTGEAYVRELIRKSE